MKDELISFETAKLAKEKDFNILQHSYYFEDGEFKENSLKGTNGYYGEEYEFNLSEFNENWNDKWLTKKTGDRCFGCSKQKGYLETFSAPTQSLLQHWLREEKQFYIDIGTGYNPKTKNVGYSIEILIPSKEDVWMEMLYSSDNSAYDTYELALEDALQRSLNSIII